MANVGLIAITRGGAQLAARLADSLPDAVVYVSDRWREEAGARARPLGTDLGPSVAELFRAHEGLVFFTAVAVAVRLVAPCLRGKHEDPAVVAVDDAGRYAVSVLSGHLGGGNALATRVAQLLGAAPIITTASEARATLSVDLLGRELGWRVEHLGAAKRASAALVNGEPVGLVQEAGEANWWDGTLPATLQRFGSLEELAAAGCPGLVITDRLLPPLLGASAARWVVYRPRTLVLGVGASSGVAADDIEALARAAVAEAGLAWASVAEVATLDRRLAEPGLVAFATRHALPLRGYAASVLAGVAVPHPSAAVRTHVGTPSVCEAAAQLAAAGPLVIGKRKSARATVAVARRGTGRLLVVGLGPGDPALLTGQARAALETADVLLGYSAYLDQVRAWLPGRDYRPSPIGAERERARTALTLAAAGRTVALVSSGDAGVYGMAGLAVEELERWGAGAPPAVEIVPGVTALLAAAALLGAPLGTDFAAISLSDLLVPWATIARRLDAAAAADFVLALYNPASAGRRWQLPEACAILRRHRSPDTPVGLVRAAYRPGQQVATLDLAALPAQAVDMLTILIVGNSQTRHVGSRLLTPRGYDPR